MCGKPLIFTFVPVGRDLEARIETQTPGQLGRQISVCDIEDLDASPCDDQRGGRRIVFASYSIIAGRPRLPVSRLIAVCRPISRFRPVRASDGRSSALPSANFLPIRRSIETVR